MREKLTSKVKEDSILIDENIPETESDAGYGSASNSKTSLIYIPRTSSNADCKFYGELSKMGTSSSTISTIFKTSNDSFNQEDDDEGFSDFDDKSFLIKRENFKKEGNLIWYFFQKRVFFYIGNNENSILEKSLLSTNEKINLVTKKQLGSQGSQQDPQDQVIKIKQNKKESNEQKFKKAEKERKKKEKIKKEQRKQQENKFRKEFIRQDEENKLKRFKRFCLTQAAKISGWIK